MSTSTKEEAKKNTKEEAKKASVEDAIGNKADIGYFEHFKFKLHK